MDGSFAVSAFGVIKSHAKFIVSRCFEDGEKQQVCFCFVVYEKRQKVRID